VPQCLTTLYSTGMHTYGSQTITFLIFTTIPPITHPRKWCGGASLQHPKLRLIPSIQWMDEECRERKWGKPYFNIYFFMTPTLLLKAILNVMKPPEYYCPIYYLKISCNMTFESKFGSSKWPLSLRFTHQYPTCTSQLYNTCYMPRLSNSSWFDHRIRFV
jgi:hypothetical protein